MDNQCKSMQINANQCNGLIAHQAQVLDPPGEPTTLVLSGAEGELVRLILGPGDAMALAAAAKA
jgi:hypothetical protein